MAIGTMAEVEPTFLVNPYSEPVVIKVRGRASFQNAAPLKSFLDRMIEEGGHDYVLDFSDCKGMDSTFLGILAGAGLKLMRRGEGSMVACRLGARNLELVRNLGLHRIMTIDPEGRDLSFDGTGTLLSDSQTTEINNARMVLEAHENLVEVDESNRTKFQDVILFLRNQVEDGGQD